MSSKLDIYKQRAHILHLMVVQEEVLEFVGPVLSLREQSHLGVIGRTHVAQPLLSRLHLQADRQGGREGGREERLVYDESALEMETFNCCFKILQLYVQLRSRNIIIKCFL